jgi:hypothetical protein
MMVRHLRRWAGGVFEVVFSDPYVMDRGLLYVERLLKNKDTHEAGNLLLVNVLKDPRFIEGSDVYGTTLIKHVLQ